MRFEIFWHANEGRYTVSIPNYPGGVVETVEQVQGGIPHGFGIYIDGKFVRVDIGGLGKVITDLQIENGYLHQALVQAKDDLIYIARSLGAPTSPYSETVGGQRKIMNDQACYARLAAKDINVTE